jgi:Trk K+ transport system NAD-binding subunit
MENEGIITVTPMKAMHTLLHAYIMYPESFDVLYNPADNDNIYVREIKLDAHDFIGTTLRDLHLPGDCLVLMVSRGGRRIVPDGSTIVEKDDVLVIIGSKEYSEELEKIL